MTKFSGTFSGQTDGGGWKVPAAIVAVVVLCGGGSAGAFAAHLTAAITDLVYWVAGVMGATVLAGGAVLAWWLHGKPGRDAAVAALMAERKRAHAAELEERAERRAVAAARAQADAWSPLLAGLAGAMRQPQPWPQQAQPVPVVRGEVER